MRTDIGVWVVEEPTMQHPGERRCLSTSGWKVPLQHEQQDQVPLRGKVGNVLRDHSALLRPRCFGHESIVGCP